MYHTFTILKKSGGVRTITAPDEELKAKQRAILKELQKKEWLSRHAHGFKKGRSILTNAQVHCGKRYVLNLDVKDFFPSIGLCGCIESALPATVRRDTVYHNGYLPQGAPTSPFISNIYMRDFDTQIIGLLRKIVSDDIQYSRYADDLTFSSNSQAIEKVVEIVTDKLKRDLSLTVNTEKTHLMKPSQRQEVTGLNINSGRPTVPKKYRKEVRALVHRVSQCGWLITERQLESLRGKVAYIAMCHPEEAARHKEALRDTRGVKEAARVIKTRHRVKMGVHCKHKAPTAPAGQTQTREVGRRLRLDVATC